MALSDDDVYMRRCLELASRASGNTSPNPMVGSVIVCDGLIIGEGYHTRAGTPHAEVIAVNSVRNRDMLPRATLYVSLEPCSHHGRTPPCADMIIESGIRKVVVGTKDTSSKVAGKGIERMRSAGIEVITGVEEEACRFVNRRFFTFHERQRPHVILKWACSADGFIDLRRKAGEPAGPQWITGRAQRVLVHKWRAEEDAIIAGGATVRADDPFLDARLWNNNNPIRVIISRTARVDEDANIFKPQGSVLLFTRQKNATLKGAEVIVLKDDTDTIEGVIETLYAKNIISVFVEGGSLIISEFVRKGLWDEARRFTGRDCFGDGVPDPFPGMKPAESISFENCILDVQYNYSVKNKGVET